MRIALVKQPLMNGVAVVHRISCTAIEPRHGRGGTARHGHTIYKSAYLEKSHTTKYLSPDKLVWGVCVIVKNGLAFSISNIVDLALGARLIHGTLTISTSTETSMTIDILGIYGPATKDPQINEPYWKALQLYVEKLYEKNEVSFTQGSRQMVIGGDWNSYRDKETDIYREYELKSCEPQDNYLNDHSLKQKYLTTA
jgi:exonuclease III